MARVILDGITKRWGSFIGVDNVNLQIADREFVVFLGPSGCGKTTTLRLIAGLEFATAGQILIGGRDATRLPASERNVSMVFQSYALFPHMTVLENVAYGPKVSGIDKRRSREVVAEKIALLGLGGLERRFPSELSGGQQQGVAVARALVLEPLVLLFDEPLSNLDAKLRRRVRDDIRDLQSRLKLTVVYVTHEQQEALAISDQVIVMAQSVIAQSGSPRELYEHPANSFVADFIGDANIVDAELSAWSGDDAVVRLAGIEVMLPHRNAPPGPVKLAIHPEAIQLRRERPAGPTLPARIVKAAYLGTHMEYTVQSGLGILFVLDSATSDPYPLGCELWLNLPGAGLTILHDRELRDSR
jgi:iron(III) transport system ATP-binding protein